MLSLRHHAIITGVIFTLLVASLVLGAIAEERAWLTRTPSVELGAMILYFSLILLFFFSLIPLMIKTVLGFQVLIGNGDHHLIRPLIVHEAKIVSAYWILLLAGLAVAAPAAIHLGFFN